MIARAARRIANRTLLAMALGLALTSAAGTKSPDAPAGFVRREGTRLVLDGKPYRIAGVNNHYLAFGTPEEVTRVLDDAVAMGANVVRTFIQPVIGSPDGTVPTNWNWRSAASASDLGTGGAYMMSWDPAAGRMAVNDGPDGLERIDFVLAEAAKRDLRLIVAFVDFWGYTGGAQQMSVWYGSTDKYTFFAQDPRTRRDYKDLVRRVLTRTNAITGRLYKDDPTVLAWDLANEPDIHPLALRIDWVGEMSAFVKSLDPAHLLATGHANMVDPFADLAAPAIDLGTWHGYPNQSGMSPDDFDALIRRNCAAAERYGKPILLEEFGVPRSDTRQSASYRQWLATLQASPGCPGWVIWRLVGLQKDGRFPTDEHDKLDIRNDASPVWRVLQQAARNLLRPPAYAD